MEPILDAEQFINDLSNATQNKPARRPQFRSSSLPACTVAWTYNWIVTELPTEQESWKRDLFMKMGHGLHEVTQKWLGRIQKLYGNWKCPKCGRKRLGMVPTCHDCNVEMEYLEWVPREREGWPTGHIDGLILPDDGRGYLVLEIKSISSNGIKNVITKPISEWPVYYKKYWQQSRSYAYMLKEQEGFNIRGVALLFICRDNTRMKMIVEDYDYEMYRNEFHANVNRYNDSKGIAEQQNFTNIANYRICKNRKEGEDCLWVGDCFVRDLADHMQRVYDIYKEEDDAERLAGSGSNDS